MFRKLDFDTIYYEYLNELPFKYYISILGGVGVQNLGKPAYIILARFIKAGCAFPKNDGNFKIDYILSDQILLISDILIKRTREESTHTRSI